MNEQSYIKLIPILIILLVVIVYLITSFFTKKAQIFGKALFSYFIISLMFVSVFAFIYMLVFVIDLQNVTNKYPNGFNNLNISNGEKQKIINGFFHIKGIGILDYKENLIPFFIDIFYFSCMTFFTVGYGDITVSGVVRIFPIIECFLGVSMTGIVISMILSNLSETNKKEDRLRMFIYRGYDILCFEKTSIVDIGFDLIGIFSERLSKRKFEKENKYIYNVHLIDSNGRVSTIPCMKLNDESKETFENFKIEWNFVSYKNQNIEYYYKFAQYLRCQLRNKIDVNQLYKFINAKYRINLEEFQQYLVKLKNSLLKKPLDDIELNNDIVELIIMCINGIDKI